ncbi:MAG: aminopeptidase P family protein [Chloroflexi bacterium]|nr:aminopeptidase P family protein [Chloroflexota bacterium]
MKSDLDRLMADRGFDAFVVMGERTANHALIYLTNGARISYGIVIQKRGSDPLLLVSPMERDEAAKSGLTIITTNEFNLPEYIKETRSRFEGQMQMLADVLKHYEVQGTVSFYGMEDVGRAFTSLNRLQALVPGLTAVGETEVTIFDQAGATKDEQELAAIRSVAERTNRVMDETMAFLTSHKAKGGKLIHRDGSPLTIGDVKRHVRLRLMHYDLEEEGEIIFAIGRDAGVPHSRGEESAALELGKSIVFDLFPRQRGGGYFHDMTRSFCLGYAPEEVEQAYHQVEQAFHLVLEAISLGQDAKDYQQMVCDFFQEQGHQTPISHPGTEEGYVHGLGHGLGLQIHSRPRMGPVSQDKIEAGQVFNNEPGLYYPERGYGIRI